MYVYARICTYILTAHLNGIKSIQKLLIVNAGYKVKILPQRRINKTITYVNNNPQSITVILHT